MIFGPDLATLREAAKKQVMLHFVGLGERDDVPATLRAMYAIKVSEAQMYLAAVEAGVTDYQSLNRCIEKDAADRGLPPNIMAHAILMMAADSLDLEDRRLKVNVRIENAKDESQIVAILSEQGLDLAI